MAIQPQQQWLLKRNCALSPGQLAVWFGSVGTLSLILATFFALQGAWPIIPFAFLECGALFVAFLAYGRHAGDYERIVVEAGKVVVERASASRIDRRELRSNWLRVEYQGDRDELIRLVSGAEALGVGRFVPREKRQELARALRASVEENVERVW